MASVAPWGSPRGRDGERIVDMLVKYLKGKIHRATVTETDLEYIGSIAIDADLCRAAGVAPYEAVLVADLRNGARFETYVEHGEPGSGVICVNGAAAHLVNEGDRIIVFSFGYMEPDEAARRPPRIVQVDEKNRQRDV